MTNMKVLLLLTFICRPFIFDYQAFAFFTCIIIFNVKYSSNRLRGSEAVVIEVRTA